MTRTRYLPLAVVAALALTVASCGDASDELAERIIESQEGVGDVEINQDGDSVTIEVEGEDGGSINFGSGASLPDGFPLPVPDGGEVLASFSSEEGGSTSYSATVVYPRDQYETVQSFYQDWYDGAGFENGNSSSGEVDGNRFFSFSGQDGEAFVNVGGSETDEDATVTLIYGT